MTEQSVISLGNGKQLPITKTGDTFYVDGVSIGAADISSSNGVIHILHELISAID